MSGDATRIRPPNAAPPRGAACLVFVEGEGALGLRVPLEREVLLGRDVACDVALAADDLSRRHARVVPDGCGHVVVDLGSTNGTWVNGERVEARRLDSGDRIALGPFVAKYLPEGDPEARALEELARLARRDALTGFANRRAFDEDLAREIARARRTGAALAVVAVDVDHFKRVNDGHGHAAGDAVLAAVAACAGASLRHGDLLARVGGEEFAAILPGAAPAAAAAIAERMRLAVSTAPVDVGPALRVTASFGVAALEAADTPATLLARADRRLYAAKLAGRDRVVTEG